MTHLTAGWLQKTGISSGILRSVIEYGLPLPFLLLKGRRGKGGKVQGKRGDGRERGE